METQDISKTSQTETRLLELANSIGDFIRYWGFRRIHGAIWTILYLSKQPLTGAELVERLQVSKALVSPALAEMEEWQLLVPVASENAKAKYYQAEADVLKVIRKVLLIREQVMIDKVKNHFIAFRALPVSPNIDSKRLKTLGSMIAFAQSSLRLFVKVNSFSARLKMFKKSPTEES